MRWKIPVQIDKYMMGIEAEVDAICDGEDYLIPGIMEHIERAGIHSGDLDFGISGPESLKRIKDTIVDYTARLAKELKIVGLMNIQYVIYNDEVYIIEVNPRSSGQYHTSVRSPVVPMVDLATRCMLGESCGIWVMEPGYIRRAIMFASRFRYSASRNCGMWIPQLGPEMNRLVKCWAWPKRFQKPSTKGWWRPDTR